MVDQGKIFRRTMYPPSLVIIVLIFSELRRAGRIRPSRVEGQKLKPVPNKFDNGILNNFGVKEEVECVPIPSVQKDHKRPL